MGGAVFECAFQLQHDIAGAVTLEPFVGDRRAGDIAAQVLQLSTDSKRRETSLRTSKEARAMLKE